MNARIRELTLVAEQYANEQTKKATELDQLLDWNNIYDEKLAQLIIADCISIVNIWSDEEPCSEGYDKFTVGKLKQHFGVE